MISCSLQSGSNGNSFYVETTDVKLLIDAGLSSGRLAVQRMQERGFDMARVDALLISHNHTDHVRAAGTLHRRFRFPIYASQGSYGACSERLGRVKPPCCFTPGETLTFGGTRVETVATPHDGVDGVAYIIEHDGRRLGVFTDLGHCFPGLDEKLASLDGLYLETNYDPDMLAGGPYPPWLRQRIAGPGGHLANAEAAGLVRDCGDRLQWMVLSHLSEQNNSPSVAMATVERVLDNGLRLGLAHRDRAGAVFSLSD